MSQIINAIPPNALLPVAGALVGWVGHMLWFRSERAHVAAGMARIRQFMRGNDEWLSGHKRVFASAPTDPDVTGEVLAIQPAPEPDVFITPSGARIVQTEHPENLPAISDLPHHDDEDAPSDDTERTYLWALVAAAIVLAPYAFARKQLGALWAYVQKRLKSNDEPYRGRHWMADVQHTGQFPVVRATGGPVKGVPYIEEPAALVVPQQRTGSER